MPGELSPADYYHYYLSSQRRVQRWVRETEKLQGLQDGQKDTVPAQHEAAVVVEKEENALRHADRRQRHGRTSSKRRNDDRSGSRPSSGGPKKIRRVERQGKSLSRGTRRRTASRSDITVFSYLPYGALPLLYTLTGSSVVSFVVAAILLVGYLCVDLESRKLSLKRTASS